MSPEGMSLFFTWSETEARTEGLEQCVPCGSPAPSWAFRRCGCWSFWLPWVSMLRVPFPRCGARRCSSLWCAGFPVGWLLRARSAGPGVPGLQWLRAQQLWPAGSRARAQQRGSTDLVALRNVESSGIRDQTRVPCTGRWVLIQCTTKEVLSYCVMSFPSSSLSMETLLPTRCLPFLLSSCLSLPNEDTFLSSSE